MAAQKTKKRGKLEKPASQVAAERLAKQEAPEALYAMTAPGDSDIYNEGYVGVDPVYQNHANDVDKPRRSEKGVEKDAEDAFDKALDGEPQEAGKQLSGFYTDTTTPVKAEQPQAEQPQADSSEKPSGDTSGQTS